MSLGFRNISHKYFEIREKNSIFALQITIIIYRKHESYYQKLNDLVEMIGETFTKPKAGEGRWWGLTEIHELLKNRYANYDPKTSFQKLGRALSDMQFGFENDRKSSGHIYKLVER